MRGFEKVSAFDTVELPVRSTSKSAGYDFKLIEDIIINPKENILIPTGVKAFMCDDEYLSIYIRSSLAIKHNIVLTNSVGIIDSDYYNNKSNEGHIFIAVKNISNVRIILSKGDKIAQGIFQKYLLTHDDNQDNLRIGGIGSTTKL